MRKILCSVLLLVHAAPALAITNYNYGNLSSVTDPMVNAMLKLAAIGTAHRELQPAGSLGMTLGLDFGIEVSAVVVPDEFKAAFSQATQQPQGNLPDLIPVPRLNIHKGLPGRFDLGITYSNYQGVLNLWGISGAWNFIPAGARPGVGFRASYGHSKLYFIESHALTFDAVVSKPLVLIEPYVGTGLQVWGGTLDVPAGGATGLPVAVSGSQSGATAHVFAGLPIKLLLIHLTADIDHSFAGITTYGGKLSLSF